MKKLVSAIIVTALVTVSLCSCGKSPETAVEPESGVQIETIQDTQSGDVSEASASDAADNTADSES